MKFAGEFLPTSQAGIKSNWENSATAWIMRLIALMTTSVVLAAIIIAMSDRSARCAETPPQPIDFTMALQQFGPKFALYFTIEVDDEPLADNFSVLDLDAAAIANLKTADEFLDYIRKIVPQAEVVRSSAKHNVVHLIAKSLLAKKGYALSKQATIAFKGSASGLVEDLQRLTKGEIVQPTGGIIGETLGDWVTQGDIRATNQSYRDILSNFLPLDDYSRIIWLANEETLNGKSTVWVKYLGPVNHQAEIHYVELSHF